MTAACYDSIPITDNDRVVAHVLFAPLSLPGIDIGLGRNDGADGCATIYGDLFIGTPINGYYTVPFEVTTNKGADGLLLLGEEEFDLTAGRCFLLKDEYEVTVTQLPCFSKEEGLQWLAEPSTGSGG